MGFYATDTLDAAPPSRTDPVRARQHPVCGQKPLRGPIHNAISGYRYNNPELGRWINRDPIGENGGLNLYGFAGNRSLNNIDVLGFVIYASCPLDKYLKEHLSSWSGDNTTGYTSGSASGSPTIEALILMRMMAASYDFKIAGDENQAVLHNIRRHVDVRAGIVSRASDFRVSFGRDNIAFTESLRETDPAAYFDEMNKPSTRLDCQMALQFMLWAATGAKNRVLRNPESGTAVFFGRLRRRDLSSGAWIPGDYGYIENAAFVAGEWNPALPGENIVMVGTGQGGDLFWGHVGGASEPLSLGGWYRIIQSWTSNDGKVKGRPRLLQNEIDFPSEGLK